MNSIKNWAEDDRPREKLLHRGRGSLSDAELLAILLGSGSARESAVDLAKRILQKGHQNWNEIARWTVNEWCEFRGVGPAKAITAIAAIEIGNRKAAQQAFERPQIQSSRDVFRLMQSKIGDLNHEEFWVIHLNRKNKIIDTQRVGQGGMHSTAVDFRLIFEKALRNKATQIIVAHNHPSGNPEPSTSDKNLTQNLKKAGEIIQIQLIDHVVIGQKEYYSFADEGTL